MKRNEVLFVTKHGNNWFVASHTKGVSNLCGFYAYFLSWRAMGEDLNWERRAQDILTSTKIEFPHKTK
jgi:hypothetical protein